MRPRDFQIEIMLLAIAAVLALFFLALAPPASGQPVTPDPQCAGAVQAPEVDARDGDFTVCVPHLGTGGTPYDVSDRLDVLVEGDGVVVELMDRVPGSAVTVGRPDGIFNRREVRAEARLRPRADAHTGADGEVGPVVGLTFQAEPPGVAPVAPVVVP